MPRSVMRVGIFRALIRLERWSLVSVPLSSSVFRGLVLDEVEDLNLDAVAQAPESGQKLIVLAVQFFGVVIRPVENCGGERKKSGQLLSASLQTMIAY